jgi:hypothetical protein
VKAGLVKEDIDLKFGSASGLFDADEPLQWLKEEKATVVTCIQK